MYRVNVRFFDNKGVASSIGLKFETSDEMARFFEQLDRASVLRYEYDWQLDGANS